MPLHVLFHKPKKNQVSPGEKLTEKQAHVKRLTKFVAFVFWRQNLGRIKMSAYKRVQQWATFAQTWHLYDAKWQNPFDSAKVIISHLMGLHKPIFHPRNQCGDHVVVINCKEIALPGDEWKRRVYFHHTGYPGGASWTLAWELHEKDPTMIMWKAVYNGMDGNLARRTTMRRLHLFADDNVPKDILGNVTSQLKQLRRVPHKIDSYSEKEIKEFPKIFDLPEDYLYK